MKRASYCGCGVSAVLEGEGHYRAIKKEKRRDQHDQARQCSNLSRDHAPTVFKSSHHPLPQKQKPFFHSHYAISFTAAFIQSPLK